MVRLVWLELGERGERKDRGVEVRAVVQGLMGFTDDFGFFSN